MRLRIRSRYLCRRLQEALLPLQIRAINWPSTNEIDAYNGDLIVASTKAIAGTQSRPEII